MPSPLLPWVHPSTHGTQVILKHIMDDSGARVFLVNTRAAPQWATASGPDKITVVGTEHAIDRALTLIHLAVSRGPRVIEEMMARGGVAPRPITPEGSSPTRRRSFDTASGAWGGDNIRDPRGGIDPRAREEEHWRTTGGDRVAGAAWGGSEHGPMVTPADARGVFLTPGPSPGGSGGGGGRRDGGRGGGFDDEWIELGPEQQRARDRARWEGGWECAPRPFETDLQTPRSVFATLHLPV